MNVKWMLRQNHLGKPLLWASFSVIHFSAMQQGRQRIKNSDFHGGFLPPTPSSLLLCLASACQTLFPQLSFIPISTWPVTTPHAVYLPIVCPGAVTPVPLPSGVGWKGCWTLVLMILEKNKTHSELKCIFPVPLQTHSPSYQNLKAWSEFSVHQSGFMCLVVLILLL